MGGPTPSLVVPADAQQGARDRRHARSIPAEAAAGAVACLSALVAYRGFLHFDRFAGRPSGFDETTGFLFEPGASSPLLVGIVTVWLLARRAARIRAARGTPAAWAPGACLLLAAAALCLWSHHAGAPILLVPSLSAALLGAGLLLGGWRACAALRFPALVLLLAAPIPTELLNQWMHPLQAATAGATARALELAGFPAVAYGDLVVKEGVPFRVIETCSGLRTAATLLLLALVHVELVRGGPLRSTLLLLATPPVAFAANLLRVLAIVLLPEIAGSHVLQGLAVIVLGVLGLRGLDAALGLALPPRRAQLPSPATRAPGRAAPQVALAAALAALAGATLWIEPWQGEAPALAPLAGLPHRLGEWSAVDRELDALFLGSVVFSESLHRRYARGPERVDLLVAADDRASERTSVLSTKVALPGPGWDVTERRRHRLSADREVERFRLRSLDGDALVYRWCVGCGSLLEEVLRSTLALDRSALRRPGRAVVVRVSTPLHPLPGAEAMAEARLAGFARVVDAALRPILRDDATRRPALTSR
jgi:EpsI family protein